MGFQDRLDAERKRLAQEAQAHAAAAEREQTAQREVAIDAAEEQLTEVRDAVAALRANTEQSQAELMAVREPAQRGNFGLGAIVATRRGPEQRRFFRSVVTPQAEFAGWWVRREPFEFEIPLEGPPRVGIFQTMNHRVGPKHTLEEFAARGTYEYLVSVREGGSSEMRVGTADQGFRDFLREVMDHLLHLGQ